MFLLICYKLPGSFVKSTKPLFKIEKIQEKLFKPLLRMEMCHKYSSYFEMEMHAWFTRTRTKNFF